MFDLLGYGRSPITNGTSDWTSTTLQHITVPSGVNTSVRLQTYGPVTSGDAWFANLSLQQEIPPALQMFLLYPNYRGMMFSDQSQIASVDLTVAPPAGTLLSSLQVVLNAADSVGNIVASQTVVPSSTEFTASIDLSSLPLGSYQLTGTAEDSSGNILMTQSPYAIVKLDASERDGMKAWIDPANRAHFLDGDPHFVLGIYDTTQYSLRESYYVPEFAAIAGADQHDHQLLHHQRADLGDYRLHRRDEAVRNHVPGQRGRSFYSGSPDRPLVPPRSSEPEGSGHVISDYTSCFVIRFQRGRLLPAMSPPDPPAPDLPSVRAHQGRRPFRFHLRGAQSSADSALMEGHRRHPGRRCVPAGEGDRQRSRRGGRSHARSSPGFSRLAAGMDRNPVLPVDLESAWRRAAGWTIWLRWQSSRVRTGLFYWEYGIRSLASRKNPVEHAALYQELIDVTTEVKSLEPVLLSPDAPVITTNSAAGTVSLRPRLAPTAAVTFSRTTTPRHRSPPSSR